jgi:hypothetical protein
LTINFIYFVGVQYCKISGNGMSYNYIRLTHEENESGSIYPNLQVAF